MQHHLTWLTGSLLSLAAVAVPRPTEAQDADQVRAILLAIRPAEGDVEFAQNLTAALRNELQRLPDWRLDERQPTLNQMLLVADCDEPDAACLGKMAEALEVDRIVYGNVRRTAAGGDYDFAVSLFVFNAQKGRITHSIAETIPRVQSDIDNLRTRARKYARQFAGIRQTGSLRITANHPGSRVLLDGEEAGVLDEDGRLVLSEVAVGRHDIEVEARGYTSFRGSVIIVADEEVAMEVELRPRERGFLLSAPTLVAGSLAAVGWIGVLVSWRSVASIDDEMAPFRADPGVQMASTPYNRDMCRWAQESNATLAAASRLRDLCGEADSWETINRFSFAIAGVATAATAVLLYLDVRNAQEADEAGEDASTAVRRNTPRLLPSLAFGPEGVHLGVHGTF